MKTIRIEPETIVALIEQHVLHVYGVAPLPGSVQVFGGLAYADIPDGDDAIREAMLRDFHAGD